MALELALDACLEGCGTLKISDTTGFYDPVNNTTGWGPFNRERADVTQARLDITYTNSAGVQTVTTIDVTTEISTSTLADVLLTSFPITGDGIYHILYSISGDSFEASTELTKSVFCNAKCCVDKLALAVAKDFCEPCSKGTATEKFNKASVLLSSLAAVSVCLGESQFLKLLGQLEKLCGGKCGCGCS